MAMYLGSNKVEIGASGGGGSSDFSMAMVNVTYVPPEEGGDVVSIEYAYTYTYYNGDQVGGFSYGSSGFPTSMLGSVNELRIPICYQCPTQLDMGVLCENGSALIDIANSEVISGDATIEDYYFMVSGDCTLKIALGWAD